MMYKEQKGHSIRNERNALSSFVKKDLIDIDESTNYIIEEDIHAPCGYESVKCYSSPNVWRIENWDIFDNHSETSSDSDVTGSYSSADEHSEIEPLWRLFFIKFRKLMYYRLTFQIQCISS